MAYCSLVKTMLLAGFVSAGAASLGGCILAAAGAGAGGGYALTQERSFHDTAQDAGIHALVAQSWKQYNLNMSEDLDSTVYEGRVLITGTVPSEEWRAEAVKRTWQVDGVKEVYDEIQVGPEEHFLQDVGDATVTSKLKAQLIADADVKEINYTITTVKGVVYIIGTARTKAELDRVVDHARNTSNVRRVVSYIRIRGDNTAAGQATGAPQPAAAPASAAAPPAAAEEQITTPTPRQEIEVTPLK